MAILKIQVNGREVQLEVYSIAELLQIIDVQNNIIKGLGKQNAELRRKVNGEVNGMDKEGGEPSSTTGG